MYFNVNFNVFFKLKSPFVGEWTLHGNIRVRKFCVREVFHADIHLPSRHLSPDTDSVFNEIKES